MKKIQVVSTLSFLIAASTFAQVNPGGPELSVVYECQQDPQLLGVGTELTVTDAADLDNYAATLTRTIITPTHPTSTQTFSDLSSKVSQDSLTRTFETPGFKLDVSLTPATSVQIGTYFPANLSYVDTYGNNETQALFCKAGSTVGFPAVTGSN